VQEKEPETKPEVQEAPKVEKNATKINTKGAAINTLPKVDVKDAVEEIKELKTGQAPKAFVQEDKNTTEEVKAEAKAEAKANVTVVEAKVQEIEVKPLEPVKEKFDVYKTELKQGLYKPKPGIHINSESTANPLNVVKEADLKDIVDLDHPRMTADNAKKAAVKEIVPETVEKSNSTNSTKEEAKDEKKEVKTEEKVEKKDAKTEEKAVKTEAKTEEKKDDKSAPKSDALLATSHNETAQAPSQAN